MIHASAVGVGAGAVLLLGPPGCGKSDLALRLIDAGARLIADDQVRLTAVGGAVYVAPPAATEGLIEVRGIGVLRYPVVRDLPLKLVVDLDPAATPVRLPSKHHHDLLGIAVPAANMHAFEASATAKIHAALRALRAGTMVCGAIGDSAR